MPSKVAKRKGPSAINTTGRPVTRQRTEESRANNYFGPRPGVVYLAEPEYRQLLVIIRRLEDEIQGDEKLVKERERVTREVAEQLARLTSPNSSDRRLWDEREERDSKTRRLLTHSFEDPTMISYVWDRLARRIGILASLHYKMISWETLDPLVLDKFESWTPLAKALLSNKWGQQILLETWIWHVINDNLLSPKTLEKWWAEEWKSYGRLKRILRETASGQEDFWTARYHHWRNFTVSGLRHAGAGNHTNVERMVDILRQEIESHCRPENTEDRESRFREIAEHAVLVDFHIQVDLTDYTVVFHHPDTRAQSGFPFHKSSDAMRLLPYHSSIPEILEGRSVDLIIAPGLRQIGSYDGCKYDEPASYSSRMIVGVDLLSFLEQQQLLEEEEAEK